MHKLSLKSICLVSILMLATGGLASANLINNGGFEDGLNFWTQNPAPSGSDYGLTMDYHSDTFAARFAASGSALDALSQTFATTIGVTYDLTFWLRNNSAAVPSNEFRVTFGGVVVQDLINTPFLDYTPFTFSVLATSSSMTLEFAGRNGAGYFALDDISVEAGSAAGVPDTGSTALLLGAALMGLIFFQRRFSAGAI